MSTSRTAVLITLSILPLLLSSALAIQPLHTLSQSPPPGFPLRRVPHEEVIVSFLEEQEVWLADKVVHLTLEVDLSLFHVTCQSIKPYLTHIREDLKVDKPMTDAMTAIVSSACQINHIFQSDNRVKRVALGLFLGGAAGILGSVFGIYSMYQQAQLRHDFQHLREQTHHMFVTIHQDHLIIGKMKRDIKRLIAFADGSNFRLSRLENRSQHQDEALQALTHFSLLSTTGQQISSAWSSLQAGRFPWQLLSQLHTVTILDQLKRAAETLKLSLIHI